jgi:hypothetical protein
MASSAREFYQSLLHMGYENAIAILEARDAEIAREAKREMRALVKKWRCDGMASSLALRRKTFADCADELEALISPAPAAASAPEVKK